MITTAEIIARRQQILDKFNMLVEKANQLYGIKLPHIHVSFDLRGRAAGLASRRMFSDYSVKFNGEMITRDAFEHVLNSTVPHELAHIVCFYKPELGANHDYGWQRVCVSLGGKPDRCHNEAVVYGKGRTFRYTTSTGHHVNVSEAIHGKVQRGKKYVYRGGKGEINQYCKVELYNAQNPDASRLVKEASTAPVAPMVATFHKTVVPGIYTVTDTRRPPAPTVRPVIKVTPVAPAGTRVLPPGFNKTTATKHIILESNKYGRSYEETVQIVMKECVMQRGQANAYVKELCRRANIVLA